MKRLIMYAATWNVFTEIQGANCPISTLMLATTARMNLDNRLRLLHEVVEVAFGGLQFPEDGNEYIKLFLAPEYYFSRTPDLHLLSHHDHESSRWLQEQLCILSSQQFARNTLIVPGTIAYYKAFRSKKNWIKTKAEKEKYEKYESVLQQANLKKIKKEHLYLAHNTAYVFFNGKKIFSYRKVQDAAEVNERETVPSENEFGHILFAPGSGNGIFNAPTQIPLTIGIEICADHACRTLEKLQQPVDLLLVPHASVHIRHDELAVKSGGYLLEAYGGLRDVFAMKKSYAWHKMDGMLAEISQEESEMSEGVRMALKPHSESRNLLRQDRVDMRRRIHTNGYGDNARATLAKTHRKVQGGILQVFRFEFG